MLQIFGLLILTSPGLIQIIIERQCIILIMLQYKDRNCIKLGLVRVRRLKICNLQLFFVYIVIIQKLHGQGLIQSPKSYSGIIQKIWIRLVFWVLLFCIILENISDIQMTL